METVGHQSNVELCGMQWKQLMLNAVLYVRRRGLNHETCSNKFVFQPVTTVLFSKII